jgi:VWFA-related protein
MRSHIVLQASTCLICLALSASSCPSQTTSVPPAQAPQPGVTTIRTVSRTVLLDIVVTDGKGHAVTGLQESDFAVLEDGGPQTVSSFVEHSQPDSSIAGKLQDEGRMPPNRFTDYSRDRYQGAWTVLFIDALYTATRDQMYVHQQIVDYMKTVPAGSKIAIFRLDSSLHLVQGFTDDPKLLLAAAENNNRDKVVLPPLTGPYYKEREALHKDAMRTIGRYLAV